MSEEFKPCPNVRIYKPNQTNIARLATPPPDPPKLAKTGWVSQMRRRVRKDRPVKKDR